MMPMFILGLQGSPRKKGNTRFLLETFLAACSSHGATTRLLDVSRQHIEPCKEYVVCEKRGYCPIEDDMDALIYPLLRQADIVVSATPVFFYGPTAQLKALIDRCQTLWARKYKLKLADPGRAGRLGFMLSVGATAGKNLFDGIDLITRYFFDAIDADYKGSLTYWHIEKPGDMKRHPTVNEDVQQAVAGLLATRQKRKTILFAGKANPCAATMAAAFAQVFGNGKIRSVVDAAEPDPVVSANMAAVMAEKGVDIKFGWPTTRVESIEKSGADVVVTLGDDLSRKSSGTHWELPDVTDGSKTALRQLRDFVELQVRHLVQQLK
jgi:multimeric flavodoxin WrbA